MAKKKTYSVVAQGKGAAPAAVETGEQHDESEVTRAGEQEYVLQERRVDTFTVRRVRIPLTPAVCRFCGFDVIAANHLPPYAELSADGQLGVVRALEEHRAAYHTAAEARVIKGKKLPASNVGAAVTE